MKTPLPLIHTSEETAFLIADYPYGRLRCQKRVWLETNNKGTRLVSRTSNPKRGQDWRNASKASTYAPHGALYLDENGHIQWDALSPYADLPEMKAFLATYGENVTDHAGLVNIVRMKEIFEEELAKFQPRPEYGTALFRSAYNSAVFRKREEEKTAASV